MKRQNFLFLLLCLPVVQVCVLMSAISSHALVGQEGISEEAIRQKWTGDYDGMLKEHVIRALIPYSKTFYFLDGAEQKGLTYEAMKEFEKYVNNREKSKNLKIQVMVIPTPRNRLFEDLREGFGDIAAGNLTITTERSKLVDFSDPLAKNVDEIVVTAAGEPAIKTVFDLSGREIYVRKSSSYYESLQKLNKGLKEMGKAPVKIHEADEYLEDEDLLEMMDAGVIPAIIIDSHKASFWAQIFKNIRLYPDVKVRTGGEIAWAIRKDSPKLKAVINDFVKKNKQGSLLGNMLINRYLKDTEYMKNNLSEKEIKKFKQIVGLFKKYGAQYNFDWLLLGAMAYQESQLDHSKRSKAGAIGIMQMLPSTARDPNVNIPDIDKLENNIHAGTKYLRFMVDNYFADEKMDDLNKGLFAFASYNAGPAKVAQLRKLAAKKGFNPDVWFGNVEVIAAQKIGRETVQYVGNIYKYYVAYKLIVDTLKPEKDKIVSPSTKKK